MFKVRYCIQLHVVKKDFISQSSHLFHAHVSLAKRAGLLIKNNLFPVAGF